MTAHDRVNDALQTSANAQAAHAILSAQMPATLRRLCDLNYLDTTGGKAALIRRLIRDRHGS